MTPSFQQLLWPPPPAFIELISLVMLLKLYVVLNAIFSLGNNQYNSYTLISIISHFYSISNNKKKNQKTIAIYEKKRKNNTFWEYHWNWVYERKKRQRTISSNLIINSPFYPRKSYGHSPAPDAETKPRRAESKAQQIQSLSLTPIAKTFLIYSGPSVRRSPLAPPVAPPPSPMAIYRITNDSLMT